MGYEIVYDKQFIDLGDNHYLPMLLWGANNCTEFINGREVLERNWSMFMRSPYSYDDFSQEKLREDYATSYSNSNYELFKEGSKWIMKSDAVKWTENCFKKAMTLDNIVKLRPSFRIQVVAYLKEAGSRDERTVYNKYCKSNAEVIEAIKEALNTEHTNLYIFGSNSYAFRHGLHLGTYKEGQAFLLKHNSYYVQELGEHGFTATRKKEDAIVFHSLQDIPDRASRWLDNYCIVKA